MKTHLFYIMAISLISVSLSLAWSDQQDHIEYLEDYIQENNLPTPAWPLKDSPVVFEIDVPVCGGN